MAFNTLENVIQYFIDQNSEFMGVESGEGELIIKKPVYKDFVYFRCPSNAEHIMKMRFPDLLKKIENDTNLKCDRCRCFIELEKCLEKDGWTLISEWKDYANTKTSVDVICPNEHPGKITQNRFTHGHGCKECAKQKMRKHNIEDVRREYQTKGLELLATEYTNNAASMTTRCSCNRVFGLSYANFLKKGEEAKCKDCTNRWKYVEVQDYIAENGCTLLSAHNEIEEHPEFILNSTRIRYTCICETEHSTIWRMFKEGSRCINCSREMAADTNMRLYGARNVFASDQIKEDIKQTLDTKYGGHHMKLDIFKDKARQSNIDNHDGVHNLNLPETRKKADDAFLEEYGNTFGHVPELQEKARAATKLSLGVDFPFQSKKIHNDIKASNFKTYGNEVFLASDAGKQLMFEKYGAESYFQSKAFTEYMILTYGAPHAMQNAELAHKALINSFSRKDFVFPSGYIVAVQGYEPFALRDVLDGCLGNNCFADEDGIVVGAKNVPAIDYYFEGDEDWHVYYPDIYLPATNTLIEVKSMYTFMRDYDKNEAKYRYACQNYNFYLLIYNPKGKILTNKCYRKVGPALVFNYRY